MNLIESIRRKFRKPAPGHAIVGDSKALRVLADALGVDLSGVLGLELLAHGGDPLELSITSRDGYDLEGDSTRSAGVLHFRSPDGSIVRGDSPAVAALAKALGIDLHKTIGFKLRAFSEEVVTVEVYKQAWHDELADATSVVERFGLDAFVPVDPAKVAENTPASLGLLTFDAW